jgi:dephospho-CoA kinase
MSKVVAIVGMAGSGKSVVSRVFEQHGFIRIRFGDITDNEVKKRGLVLNEENERRTREALRKQYGMAAYALLNQSRVDKALKRSDVVLDGLYSWEEYDFFRQQYGGDFQVVAVWSSPASRYARLKARNARPLTAEEAANRDRAEIENLNKGGPIAMADFTIINESTLAYLKSETERIVTEVMQG